MKHRKSDHSQIVKMCKYYTQNKCAYNNDICWYKHDKADMFCEQQKDRISYNCKFCDNSFKDKSDFMEHKKNAHIQAVPKCKNFMKGNCSFNNDKCWYSHSAYTPENTQENTQEDLVFQKGQEKHQPPDMILRLFSMMEKMIVKVDSLEKVSKKIQQN